MRAALIRSIIVLLMTLWPISTLSLAQALGRVNGVVTFPGGVAAAGAVVVAAGGSGATQPAIADSNGRFAIALPVGKTYVLQARAARGSFQYAAAATVTISPVSASAVALVLRRTS
jgi:hypothetical protein